DMTRPPPARRLPACRRAHDGLGRHRLRIARREGERGHAAGDGDGHVPADDRRVDLCGGCRAERRALLSNHRHSSRWPSAHTFRARQRECRRTHGGVLRGLHSRWCWRLECPEGASFNYFYYPWTFLLPGGDLLIAGPEKPARRFDPTATPIVDRQFDQLTPQQRGVNMDGTAVLLPLPPPPK